MASKTVLITGCSEGTIGNALALEFANHGWHVYATARKTTTMSNLASSANITLLSLDISDRASVVAAHDQIAKDNNGKLDILYHNAGYRALQMAIDRDPKDESTYINTEDAKMFETNVLAIMASTRILAPLVIAAKGTIAFTGSVSSIVQAPSSAAYNATKAALDQYTKCLRLEVAPLGVKVVHVVTGTVRSYMSAQRVAFPEGSFYERIAGAIDDGWNKLDKSVVPADKYAKYVVKKVASTSPPKTVWAGGNANLVYWVDLLGLKGMFDGMMSKDYGLDKNLV